MAPPFSFMTSVQSVQLTGRRVATLADLHRGLAEVDGSAIYHHTHRYYRAHSFLGDLPISDFAFWVRENLREPEVAERLSTLDLRDYPSIRALRNALIEAVETVKDAPDRWERRVTPGLEFYFCRSVSLILPTGVSAHDLPSLVDALKRIDTSSLYYHLIEAPLRLQESRLYRNDLSVWLDTALVRPDLAEALDTMDPYRKNLEGLRADIISLFRPRRLRRILDNVVKNQPEKPGIVSKWFRRWRGEG